MVVSRPIAARAALAGWLRGLGQALDALVFPWSCSLCGMEGLSEPFCRSCRQGVAGAIGKGHGVGLSALCLAGWPVRGFREGLLACAAATRWASTRRLHSGHTIRRLHDLCLRLKHERNAWLAPWLSDLLVEAGAMHLAT